MSKHYIVTARVTNRPNGEYRFSTGIPTFLLDETFQMITNALDAARIARSMIADLVRQDLSAGAEIHGEVYCADTDDYASI